MTEETPSKKTLIEELNALKEKLGAENGGTPNTNKTLAEIPVLDTPIENKKEPSKPLTKESLEGEDFSTEILIQELIDELLPTLEAKLREKLKKLSPELLQQLLEKP